MGAWGYGITSDDSVADIVDFVKDRLKNGDTLELAVAQAEERFSEMENDEDDGPLFWLAIAHVQWKWGTVESRVLNRVRSDIAAGSGLERWSEDAKALTKRRAALAKFLNQIESPNPKSSAIPKLVIRKAPFHKGDCLSILLPDGRYTAALVLGEDNSRPEIGLNLVASLDYYEPESPSLDFFERREWLILAHGNWNGARDIRWFSPAGFNRVRKSIAVVGHTAAKPLDPDNSKLYSGWINLSTHILLVRAHRNDELR